MPVLTEVPVLAASPTLERSIRFQVLRQTDADLAQRTSLTDSYPCRVIRETFAFDFVTQEPPLFASRTPVLNGKGWDDYLYIEAWRGDQVHFSRVSPEFMRLCDNVFRGMDFKTLTERFAFHPLQN